MKGYRELRPREVPREGDVKMRAPAMPHFVYFRKARTDGCPHGWRWADAGEAPSHWLFPEGVFPRANRNKATRVPHDSTKMDDNDGYVMPYPEDPRLEE